MNEQLTVEFRAGGNLCVSCGKCGSTVYVRYQGHISQTPHFSARCGQCRTLHMFTVDGLEWDGLPPTSYRGGPGTREE